MSEEKNKFMRGTGAAKFQGLEKNGSQISNDWKSAKYTSWLAAFIAAFCASAFVIVARCLLRQSADYIWLNHGIFSFAFGGVFGVILYVKWRMWSCPLAVFLAAAGAMASAWYFKELSQSQLHWAIVPFLFFSGALFGTSYVRNVPALVFAIIGALAAQPSISWLIPEAGYTVSLYVLVGLFALTFFIVAVLRRANFFAVLGGMVALGIAAYFAPDNLSRVSVPDGWTLFARREGVGGAVTLLEKQTKPGQPILQRLILDNRFIIGGQLGFGEKRLGHLPLLLKPGAKSVLFLNANAGVSMGAAKSHVSLEKIDCVEPLPEIIAFLPQFATVNDQIVQDPRTRFFDSDIPRFLAMASNSYDVIVANPTPPSRAGAARLFTAEFYAATGRRLAPGGVFVQWLPLFQLDEENLKTIVRTFAASFHDAQGLIGIYNGELPVFGLFCRATVAQPAASALADQRSAPPSAADIQKNLLPNLAARAYVADIRDLLASRILDTAALKAFAGDGRKNYDTRSALLLYVRNNEAALNFTREMRMNPQDARRGGQLLAKLLSYAPTNAAPDALANLGSDATAETLRKAVATRSETMRHYISGDILRACGDEAKYHEMADEYLRALGSEPDFPLTRAMLLLQTLQKPKLALQIYSGMLKLDPNDQQAKAMICTVQEKNAVSAGVPLPPSNCAPGSLPAMPPASGKKFPAFPGLLALPSRKIPTTNSLAPPVEAPKPITF